MKSRKVSQLFDITGKVAIVTGAAGGIGRAVALDLARFGASVVVADMAREGAERVAGEIESAGGKAIALKTDVTRKEEVEQMAQQTVQRFGRIDILINNAGIMGTYGIMGMKEADLNRTLEVNLKGIIFLFHRGLRHVI